MYFCWNIVLHRLFSGAQNVVNNDSVLRDQNIVHGNVNTSLDPVGGSGNTPSRPTNSNNHDSGFNTMNRTDHDRSSNFPQSSGNSRSNNFGNQNSSFLPPPNRTNNPSSSSSISSQNRNSFGNPNPQDGDIVCTCNVEAKLFTVRKEGPNTGMLSNYFLSNESKRM